MLVCLFEKNKKLLFNLSLLNVAVLSLVHITDCMFVCDKISKVQFTREHIIVHVVKYGFLKTN